ncbi:MAG TPA: hypothetical protein ENK61_02055 [Devosia sp.]|nr:hypothetical protein [Devosia sp.]
MVLPVILLVPAFGEPTLQDPNTQTPPLQAPPSQQSPASQQQQPSEQTSPPQVTPPPPTPEQEVASANQQLIDIQAAITLSEERRERLRLEIEEMSGDRDRQNAALIAAAQRVKLTEIEVSDIEQRLSSLIAEENLISARLEGADINISDLLSALQRIGKNPPPALIIDPTDALNSARSAILLSAILPQLRQKADLIIADLEQLQAIKTATLNEKQALSARYSTLFEEQLRIATLIEARKRGVVRVGQDLAIEEARAEQLAREATSLTQLVDSLTLRIAAVAEAAAAQERAERAAADNLANALANGTAPRLSDEAIALAFADTKRTSPAISIALAKGYLSVPAAGVSVKGFGTDDGFGGISKGVSIVTRADAQVIAPADGWVMYKGPYLNYGQIIILNPGSDYTILLAGMEEVDVELGQFVLMGEPVGKMGSRIVGQTASTSAGVSRPTLYIEIRNLETPLDPSEWWAKPTTAIARSQTTSR